MVIYYISYHSEWTITREREREREGGVSKALIRDHFCLDFGFWIGHGSPYTPSSLLSCKPPVEHGVSEAIKHSNSMIFFHKVA